MITAKEKTIIEKEAAKEAIPDENSRSLKNFPVNSKIASVFSLTRFFLFKYSF
jgi:hypothetical protein